MLNEVKTGTRVTLENGMKATVTKVLTSWGSADGFEITPDGGLYKTRKYDTDGVVADGRDGFNVASVTAIGYKGTVNNLKADITSLRETIDLAFVMLTEQAEEMEATANTPPAQKLTKYDFGAGEVPAHRHTNPDGSIGGIVADTALVSANSRVGRGSFVYGNAVVKNGAHIKNNARISGGTIDGTVIAGVAMAEAA